jgi:hypothetical protein
MTSGVFSLNLGSKIRMIPTPPTPPPPPKTNGFTGLGDAAMLFAIILFFCIFPPVSVLLIVLWIIDEIRQK